VHTLGDVHKLYTSQLIAVMVKEEKAKDQQRIENEEKTKICRLFSITSFTRIQNRKQNTATAWFDISSRSVGVSHSQEKSKKRVISQKRTVISNNFNAISHDVHKNVNKEQQNAKRKCSKIKTIIKQQYLWKKKMSELMVPVPLSR